MSSPLAAIFTSRSFLHVRPKQLRNSHTRSNSAEKAQTKRYRGNDDIVTVYKDFGAVTVDPVPVAKRKGFAVTEEARAAFAARDSSKDDPDAPVLPPDKWAHAMRRDEYFRAVKKQTTVRIDADVLAWLRSKGEGHLRRLNTILREAMEADPKTSRPR